MAKTMPEKERVLLQRFTHALMSPLTVILGSAEMLESRAMLWPEASRELLQLILSQARCLQETLAALVATAEVQGKKVQVSWAEAATCPPDDPMGSSAKDRQEPGHRDNLR